MGEDQTEAKAGEGKDAHRLLNQGKGCIFIL